ncbi:MAG: glycosyltransferase family 2 protein [Candidatus Thermoplasmatota archaeon]|nr:glycosyltransferase family 2 protein [Candidatus Thermoplasmatota archaeon]
MVDRRYILVTPCKNEEASLPKLAESIVNQTLLPELWVIVDDGSTDQTSNIITNLSSKYEWIHCLKLNEKPRDLGIHISYVYRSGFEYAFDYCDKKSIVYSYIGVVDADINFEENYFQLLIHEFENNSHLGICSGHVGNIVNGKLLWSDFREDLPTGGARLWSKACFLDTGGYLLTCSPDAVSNIKAKIRKWDTKQFYHIKAISTRPYSGAQGQWAGYKRLGSNNYFVGFTPLHALLKGLTMLYSIKSYHKCGIGFAYICGYFEDYIKNNPRINDEDVFKYYQRFSLGEAICLKIKKRINY